MNNCPGSLPGQFVWGSYIEMPGLANDRRRCCINDIVRRPVWLRLFIGLWGLWFNAALLEAPGIHTCAVHSNVATAAHHHGSAEMSMPMPDHEQATSSHQSNDSSHPCSCLSTCCSVSPFVAAQAPAAPSAALRVSSPARIGVYAAAPTIDRPHTRPFANGPPSLI